MLLALLWCGALGFADDYIKAGLSPKGLAKSISIEDRREAIRTAIVTAADGAAVLLAGKGHETYQILGKDKLDFDEKAIVNEIFHELNA